MARPVDERFPISQLFAGLATRGVVGRPDGSEVEYLVWLYGDYQPYGHAGVDIACPVGTPIRAMRAGTVVYAGWGEDLPGDDSWGPSGYFRRWGMYKNFPGIVTVIKADGTDEFDIYGHQSDNDAVRVGMHVDEAQIIGKSGDTKTRTQKVGPHLHVVTVADPLNYSTDWPRLIFGCVDPTPLFGSTGIVLQGALTNAATQYQEDDVVTAEDRRAIALETAEAVMGWVVKDEATGYTAALSWYLLSRKAATEELVRTIAQTTAQTILNAPLPDVRTGGSTSLGLETSWAAANAHAIMDKTGAALPEGLDADTVAELVREGIQKATDGMSITLSAQNGGNPNG